MTSAPVAALSASRSCLRRLLVAVLAMLLLAPAVLAQPEEPAAEAVYEAGHPGLEPPTRRPESREPVPYPKDAGGEKGRVILRVRVSPGGSVTDVEVVRAPYKGDVLRRAAIDAARGWRYQPARLDGEDVSCWLVESVEFYRIELATPPPAAPAATRRDTPPDDTPASSPAPAGPAPTGVPPAPIPAAPEPPHPAPHPGLIRAEEGGPGALLLGATAEEAMTVLGGAARTPGADGTVRLSAPGRGIEARLGQGPGGELVVAIRYVFEEGREGFAATTYRTRRGLGRGSFCLGVTPAYGRPTRRVEGETADGRPQVVMEYRRGSVKFDFVCVDGKLAELVLTTE